jgi:hypothetical protein
VTGIKAEQKDNFIMEHRKITMLSLLLLATILSACGSAPMLTPTLAPTSVPTPYITTAEGAFNLAEKCAQQWESTQKSEDLDCAKHYYQEAIQLSGDKDAQRPYRQFRFDRLLWLSGQEETQVREDILNFIRSNLGNQEATEFFFGTILPKPQPADVGATFVIYKDGWEAPHFAVAQSGVQLQVSETYVPGNVYEGRSSLQLKWNKDSGTWASLVIGFDPNIADADRARAGAMLSLTLDPRSKNDYRLEFAVKKEGPVVKYPPQDFMRIKLQDQNLIISESIGNQLVCHIDLTQEWTIYSIPLGEFGTDPWIIENYANRDPTLFRSRPSLDFDWSRVKQINFDVPYYASGNGTIWLDNIRLVRKDSDSTLSESQWWPQTSSVITTCKPINIQWYAGP